MVLFTSDGRRAVRTSARSDYGCWRRTRRPARGWGRPCWSSTGAGDGMAYATGYLLSLLSSLALSRCRRPTPSVPLTRSPSGLGSWRVDCWRHRDGGARSTAASAERPGVQPRGQAPGLANAGLQVAEGCNTSQRGSAGTAGLATVIAVSGIVAAVAVIRSLGDLTLESGFPDHPRDDIAGLAGVSVGAASERDCASGWLDCWPQQEDEDRVRW